MTKDSVRVCPQCASATVNFSELAGGSAKCRGCQWYGPVDELIVMPIQHDFLSGESAFVSMLNELRKMFGGELGLPYLKFLLKWGFLPGNIEDAVNTIDRKKFARYIAAIVCGVLKAMIAERERQAVEDAQKGKALS